MIRVAMLAGLLLALALPAGAGATLVYQRGASAASVWVAADDGSNARRLTAGQQPRISPDGQTVAFLTRVATGNPRLNVISVAGGTPRTILRRWQYGAFAWSPDSRTIVSSVGPQVGSQRLVLVDVASGATRTLATGTFYGASFSPSGDQVAYGRSPEEEGVFVPTDVWAAPVAGGVPRRLTTNRRSLQPVWGPTEIAFTRWQRPTGRHAGEDGPKYNLWLMAPDGSNVRQLTRDRVPFLLTGLIPTAWSADGTRLLAEFTGQDTAYGVTVDVGTGAQRRVGGNGRRNIVATALSRDGSTILGQRGEPIESRRPAVVAVPYGGGAVTVLARRASSPDWSR